MNKNGEVDHTLMMKGKIIFTIIIVSIIIMSLIKITYKTLHLDSHSRIRVRHNVLVLITLIFYTRRYFIY